MLKIVHAAALTVAAALLAASPAAADPFQSFLKACVTTDGAAAAAISAMGDIGWKPLPPEALGGAELDDVQDLTIHINFDPASNVAPDSLEMLMTGIADGAVLFDTPGVMMNICGVMSSDANAQALIEQMNAYLNAPPQLTESAYSAWIYSRQNGRFVPETELMEAEDEALLAALRQRPLFAIYVLEEDELGGLMLGALRATKGAARQTGSSERK